MIIILLYKLPKSTILDQLKAAATITFNKERGVAIMQRRRSCEGDFMP